MTRNEWLDKVVDNKADFTGLIDKYHPVNRSPGLLGNTLPITAHGAEAACAVVRREISKDPESADPVGQFNDAIAIGDVAKLRHLFNQTWFGVPESTLCWAIPGFSAMVELLEDPADEVE